MKLSISNIAWSPEQDETVYGIMRQYGFTGLEIAPTRWFANAPYECIQEAQEVLMYLNRTYGFRISSIQSIWYGRTENIWNSPVERERLAEYTEKAIEFAAALKCNSLVFGCPKNRNRPEAGDDSEIISFFRRLGAYAKEHRTVVALEANPMIYNTNYINYTKEAVALAKQIASPGIQVNLDVGTMIENGEGVEDLEGAWEYINHVHISEPYLGGVKKCPLHKELAEALKRNKYSGYVSIEMGRQSDNAIKQIDEAMAYVAEVFG